MIRLRVDWHSKCPGCGTELVVDFLKDSTEIQVCPWCGCDCESGHVRRNGELRKYLTEVVKCVEAEANYRMQA